MNKRLINQRLADSLNAGLSAGSVFVQKPSALTVAIRHAIHSCPFILPVFACTLPGMVFASPEGGQVVAGSATIGNPDANTTLITQSSAYTAIDWQRFNIGAQEYVQFVQPDSSSVALNRVVGGNPSEILGNLSANGQVFLVNPNGIYFGQTATVDVGGIVASVLDIRTEDFMAGNYVFSKADGAPDNAGVVNDGLITAREAGYVVLMGDYVRNNGIISARLGTVALAAGNRITMDVKGNGLVSVAIEADTLSDLAGVSNTGEIMAAGGRVIMSAKVASDLIDTAINNEGLVVANSITERNGVIFLTAAGGDVVNSGTLDASAEDGSNVDGGGVLVYSDKNVVNASGAVISATGDGSGAGGVVRVIAEDRLDHQLGALIDVSGSDHKGGFVEVSGHGSLAIRGDVALGSGGSILIDPAVLNIHNSGSSPGVSTASTYYVGKGFIETQLNLNNNVTLVASSSINAVNSFAISAAGNGNLAIKIGTLTSGAGTLGGGTFNCGIAGVCNVGTSYVFTPGASGDINLGTVSFNLAGGLSVAGGTTTGNVDLGWIDVGGNVSVTAGTDINLQGTVYGAGTSFRATAGRDIAVNASFGSSDGASLNANVTLKAGNNININSDILLANNTLKLAADNDSDGTGDVNINGISGQTRTVSTGGGSLTVSGQNFNVVGASTFGFTGSASQINIEADDKNALTTTDNLVINLAGTMNLTAGNGFVKATSSGGTSAVSDVSVKVFAGNDVTVNAGSLNVSGGNMAASGGVAIVSFSLTGDANALLGAGRDIDLNLTNGLSVLAGNANKALVGANVVSAVANADATVKAGRNVNINVAAGDIAVNGGVAVTQEPSSGCSTCVASASATAGIEAGGQMILSATGGNILLTQGSEVMTFSFGPAATVAKAGTFLSAGDLSAVAGQDISLYGSLINTGVAGGAAWFLDAGNDIIVNANQGSVGARFNDALTLSAGNNINIGADVFLSNHTLTLRADDDATNVGDVNISGQVGRSVSVETQGALIVSGQNLNVIGASSAGGFNATATSQVFVKADDNNATTTTDNITVTVAGNMNVTGGTGWAFIGDGSLLLADVSANVSAGNDITINAGSLNIKGGTASGSLSSGSGTMTAKADATVTAGRNLTATLGGNLNVSGGQANATGTTGSVGTTNINANANAKLAASGTLKVNASGSILLSLGTETSTNVSPPITATLSAGAVVNAGVLDMTAASNITGNSADISAAGMHMAAGNNIDLQTSKITVGNGTVAGIKGDAVTLAYLASQGITSPSTPNPNAKFSAGGVLSLGTISMDGNVPYLWLEADTTNLAGLLLPNASDVVVQYSPFTLTATIGVEALPSTSRDVNYNNLEHFGILPGTTIIIGSSLQTGEIFIGDLSKVNIGTKNMIAVTASKITSISNVISTGIVAELIVGASTFITPVLTEVERPLEHVGNAGDEKEKKKSLIKDDEAEINICEAS